MSLSWATTPALKAGAYSGAATDTLASNTFSPPAGSVIIVTGYAQNDYGPNGWNATPATITDSLATHLTWNLFLQEATTTYESAVTAWWAYCPSAQTNMTASVTYHAGDYVQQVCVSVDVWSGANTTAPIGATAKGTFGGQTISQSLTPTASGSALVLAAADGANTLPGTAGTGCYLLDNDSSDSLAIEGWLGTSTTAFTATTSGTPETVSVKGGSSSALFEYIAYEVVAASSGTVTPAYPSNVHSFAPTRASTY